MALVQLAGVGLVVVVAVGAVLLLALEGQE